MHAYAGADGIANAGALTAQLLPRLVEAEIFAAQFGDVYQPLDVHRVQRHKNAESGRRRDDAAEFFTQMLAHVLALQPGFDVAAGLVSAALVGAAMQARRLPGQFVSAGFFGFLLRFLDTRRQPLRQFRLGFARRWQRRQLVLGLVQHRLDDAVYQQVRVAANRAGEVRVSLIRQTEMAAVHRCVDRLLHRAQQHRMDLLRVGPVFGSHGDLLEFARRRVVSDRHAQAERLEVIAQHVFLFGRRALVYAEQAHMLAASNEVGRADVGGQHGLFDQAVSHVACTRHDFFDAPGFVANNLRLGGFKIDRAANAALFQQRLVHIVQIKQMRHQRLALRGLRPARVGQNGSDLGVGKTCLAEHHRRVELVGMHLALGVDQHVADHAQALDIRVQGTQTV